MQPDNLVTIRFQRLSPDSMSNMEGFLMRYGCSGQPSPHAPCKNSPVLLMTSNEQQSAACAEHIVTVLQSIIDSVLRSKNGERPHGFLHRPEAEDEIDAFLLDERVQATEDIIWQNRLDRRYDIVVFASKKPYVGVLVVRDGDAELCRQAVRLSYNAIVGPDIADVDAWENAAIAVVDRAKPPKQRLDDALARVRKDRSSRLRRLQRAPGAAQAYEMTLKALRYPEVAVEWLASPNAALQRKAPIDLLDDGGGIERIQQLLDNYMSTIYPLG